MSRVLVVLFFAVVAQARAATVKGTIILNEVGGPPGANVQIIGSAHTGGPWASGSDGAFTLGYPKRQPGQRVRIVVNKEGYVVVNDVQLELALPADPDANPLRGKIKITQTLRLRSTTWGFLTAAMAGWRRRATNTPSPSKFGVSWHRKTTMSICPM
jgi:hypothetical protein